MHRLSIKSSPSIATDYHKLVSKISISMTWPTFLPTLRHMQNSGYPLSDILLITLGCGAESEPAALHLNRRILTAVELELGKCERMRPKDCSPT